MQISKLPKQEAVRIIGQRVCGLVVGNRISVSTPALGLSPVFICPPGFTLFLQTSPGEDHHQILMLPNDTEVTYDLDGKD